MITLGVIASIVIGVTGALAAPALLRAMGATDDVLTTGPMFTRVLLGGSGTAFLLFVINAPCESDRSKQYCRSETRSMTITATVDASGFLSAGVASAAT